MAYYNANRVIKLTRKAMGLTQEKLSEGICEVETYSRIENGHRTVKRETYQKLMEKMGRITDKRYAVCVSKDGMLLDEKVELERAFKRYDYEAAEKYLKILKEKADDNLLTRQYMARAEALVEYHSGRISVKELVKRLDEALRMTVPEYEKYIENDKIFSFFIEEVQLLINLGSAYRRSKEFEKSINTYKYVLCCLNEKYIGEPLRISLFIMTKYGISIVYERTEKFQDALKEVDECLELVLKNNYGHLIPTLMTAKAHYTMRLIEKGIVEQDSIDKAKNFSQYAFYIASARSDTDSVNRIRKFYNENFVDDITLS